MCCTNVLSSRLRLAPTPYPVSFHLSILYKVCLWPIPPSVININHLHQSFIWQTRPTVSVTFQCVTPVINRKEPFGPAHPGGSSTRRPTLSSRPGIPSSFGRSGLQTSTWLTCSLDGPTPQRHWIWLCQPLETDRSVDCRVMVERRRQCPVPCLVWTTARPSAVCSLSRVIDAGNEATCVVLHYRWNSSTGQMWVET